MKNKGFFGYGHCPNCNAFLKEKDLEKNTCWSCNKTLEKKQSKEPISVEMVLGHIETSIDINNESYDKNGMIYYLNKTDDNFLKKLYEEFLSKYNLRSAEIFAAKQIFIKPKYDIDSSYHDKRLKIYNTIKEDLEKLVKRDKE